MTPQKVNLAQKFGLFADHWNPRVAGDLNGQQVKLVKVLGEFVWHQHDKEDELFLVVKGSLRVEFEDGSVTLAEGEFVIVPAGVRHRPVAETEAHVLLFEPGSTLNTGDAASDMRRERLERI